MVHHARPVASDFPRQPGPAGREFLRLERVDSRRGPRADVGDAVPERGQAIVVFVGHGFGNQAGLEQQFPEAVRIAGEVMSRLRGPDPGVDADEQDADAGPMRSRSDFMRLP
jgi:hypothetical protein